MYLYELFPARCMVSPNEVEEIKVWTGYQQILGSQNICSREDFHKKSQLV